MCFHVGCLGHRPVPTVIVGLVLPRVVFFAVIGPNLEIVLCLDGMGRGMRRRMEDVVVWMVRKGGMQSDGSGHVRDVIDALSGIV